MKKYYESPFAEIEKFTVDNVMTNPQSGQGDYNEEVSLFSYEQEF